MARVAINGFGRIGRTFFRSAFNHPDIEIVAINDLGSLENLAYLLTYDSAYGRSPFTVEVKENQAKIKSVLAQLSKEQEEVVRLSFFEEKTHPVIADELKLPLGTVKSRIRLAMQKIRELMGE